MYSSSKSILRIAAFIRRSMASHQGSLPYFAEGEVVSGFGRGSKELGIPTANFPEDVIRKLPGDFECGVYYGWAKLNSYPSVFKMTMCVGWNPYYQNTVKTMETHIIHQFDADFYGDVMKIIVVGFMRPMCDFPSLDALIKAIHNDIDVAKSKLDEEGNAAFQNHAFFQVASDGANPSTGCTNPSTQPTETQDLCDTQRSNNSQLGCDANIDVNNCVEDRRNAVEKLGHEIKDSSKSSEKFNKGNGLEQINGECHIEKLNGGISERKVPEKEKISEIVTSNGTHPI